MTIAAADRPTTAGADEVDGELPPAADRGQLVVDDRVVEKVAARAVAEVDRATGTPRTLFGQTLGRAREDSPARVAARVDGELVTVSVSMSVRWPAPVREVAAQVRRQVVRGVEDIVGLRVVEVDIEVPTLLTRYAPPPRVR